jgi:hypothetical protein
MPRSEPAAGNWVRRLLARVAVLDCCRELATRLGADPQACAVGVLAVAHEDAAGRGSAGGHLGGVLFRLQRARAAVQVEHGATALPPPSIASAA